MTLGTVSILVGVILLVLLKLLSKNKAHSGQNSNNSGHDTLFKEEPEFDRTWSFLPGNIFNRSDRD